MSPRTNHDIVSAEELRAGAGGSERGITAAPLVFGS
jgi:hypothetical protein